MKPLLFQFQQRVRGNRLDFRHNQIRLFLFDHPPHFAAVEHGETVTAVSNLHRWRVGISVAGDHFDSKPLQLNHNFLTKLT